EAMVAKIPLEKGDTKTGTMMSYGYNPYLTTWSPFHGAVYAVVESVAKIVATGGDPTKIRFTFQEYFKRLNKDAARWGEPFSALLGAYYAQDQLQLPSIGGKDSMSGTFHDIDVPPTLVSFAVDVVDVTKVVSPEFKQYSSQVVCVVVGRDAYELPDFQKLQSSYNRIYELFLAGKVLAAHTVGFGGISEAVSKMSFGSMIGLSLDKNIQESNLFTAEYGSIILELNAKEDATELLKDVDYFVVGTTQKEKQIQYKEVVMELKDILVSWQGRLEDVFPTQCAPETVETSDVSYFEKQIYVCKNKIARPKVMIPVFPGTNCEYDSKKAFEAAGAEVSTLVFKNIKPGHVNETVQQLAKVIRQANMVMIPGGFSAGDEPDGSGKFIATVFRNPYIKEAISDLLNNRDGLMLGICNGFQALIKLGLVPFGEIVDIEEKAPTLTYNTIGRHISCMAKTKIISNKSPWLANVKVGDVFSIPVSHGEGRFLASSGVAEELFRNGQVASTYVDEEGKPSMEIAYNPNGSVYAIEGITSPDGRVLGKMGHSERIGTNVYKNIFGEKDQRIFKSGVEYFTV
ncbi:MAG: phosphoribosylformylglycinamidine synthase subunit PurQ, partial [Vallitaleaceae bacterium]|nr:phosphoribosylformylglycinamidine synthase subunit PurQ [Vallitaleaceae bacterium]